MMISNKIINEEFVSNRNQNDSNIYLIPGTTITQSNIMFDHITHRKIIIKNTKKLDELNYNKYIQQVNNTTTNEIIISTVIVIQKLFYISIHIYS